MAGKQHYRIIPIYHELMQKKGGELPTVREIVGLTGAPAHYVRGVLNLKGLAYRHIVDNGPAMEAHLRKRDEKDKAFREKHESLTRSAGRYPTRAEMNKAMGYAKDSGMSSEVAKRLGLKMTVTRQRRERPPEPEKKPELPPVVPERDFGHRATPSMSRILEIKQGDTLGEGKGWGHIAGEEYAPTDRIMITCPVCGAHRIISPRMHPFWLRNRLGKVVFVDSRACTGQVM